MPPVVWADWLTLLSGLRSSRYRGYRELSRVLEHGVRWVRDGIFTSVPSVEREAILLADVGAQSQEPGGWTVRLHAALWALACQLEIMCSLGRLAALPATYQGSDP